MGCSCDDFVDGGGGDCRYAVCPDKCGYLVTGHMYSFDCSYKRYKLLDFLYKLTISAAVHAIDDPLVPT
jgi:hypothetical protein